MYTIVGLGNPGEKYEATRHNAGRIILREAFAESLGKLADGRSTEIDIVDKTVMVAFPDTYMNESGNFVRRLIMDKDPSGLILVYDDVDLPLGEIKLSFGRGDGGHNGVASVISALDTKDFIRIRVGISKKNFWGNMVRVRGEELADFVLERFSTSELKSLKSVSMKVKEVLEVLVKDGLSVAMNRFN